MTGSAFSEKLLAVAPVLPYASLGVWLAWVNLATTGIVWLSSPDFDSGVVMQFCALYSSSCGFSLIVGRMFATRFQPFLDKAVAPLVGGLVAAVGSLGMLLAGPYMLRLALPDELSHVLFCLFSCLSGIGAAVIVLKWAQVYGSLLPRNAIVQSSWALIVMVGVYFVSMGFPDVRWAGDGPMVVGSIAFVALPLLAGWMLFLTRYARSTSARTLSDGSQAQLPAAFWRMVAVITILTLAERAALGYMDVSVARQESTTFISGVVLLQLFVAVAFTVLAILYDAKRNNLGRLFAVIMVVSAFFVVVSPGAGTSYTGYYQLLPFAVHVFEFVFRCLLFFVIFQRRLPSLWVFGFGYGVPMVANGVGAAVGGFVLPTLVTPEQAQLVWMVLALVSLAAAFLLFSGKDFDELFEEAAEGQALSDLMNRRIESGDAIESHRGKFKIAIGLVADEYSLSRREREVLRCLAMGYDTQKIADELTISWNTVRTHTKNVYAKLGVHSRQEAASLVDSRKSTL